MQKEEQVSFLAEKIRQADAVLIGGGSGLSSAAGYNHYHWLPYMEECLQDFKEWYAPTGQPYYDLRDIVAEKEVFVLTTNIDMQFERIFQKERICDYQGNSGYVQCSQPCHDQIYSNVEMIRRMNENIRELRVTSELLPRCNECGRIMVPWVRDDTFWRGKTGGKVFYACLNQKKSSTPEHIKDKGIYIAGDLAETLRDLKENIAGKEM